MLVPFFLVGTGLTEFDDKKKYKKAESVTTIKSEDITTFRTLVQKIKGVFIGTKGLTSNEILIGKMINKVILDAQSKLIDDAIKKYNSHVVAFVDTKYSFDVTKTKVTVMLSATPVLSRTASIKNTRKNIRKNKANRNKSRKNRK
jgi:hypothetical protein